jgi:hypothetical protein
MKAFEFALNSRRHPTLKTKISINRVNQQRLHAVNDTGSHQTVTLRNKREYCRLTATFFEEEKKFGFSHFSLQ